LAYRLFSSAKPFLLKFLAPFSPLLVAEGIAKVGKEF